MKENKPILFINSASTNNFYQKNQFVYDSRKKNNTNNKVEKPKPQEQVDEREQVFENEPINQDSEIEMTEQTDFEEQNEVNVQAEESTPVETVIQEEVVEIEKPFANKIRLLTKRALLNRYVLVAVVLNEGEVEGLFKNSNDQSIILQSDNEDVTIPIDDIVDIRIIRV